MRSHQSYPVDTSANIEMTKAAKVVLRKNENPLEQADKEANHMEKTVVDLSEIPKETLDWLKSIDAVDFESPVVFAALHNDGVWMHYTYDYLIKTPLSDLKAQYERQNSLSYKRDN